MALSGCIGRGHAQPGPSAGGLRTRRAPIWWRPVRTWTRRDEPADQGAGPRVRLAGRTSHGFYVPAGVDADRRRAADGGGRSVPVCRQRQSVTGWAALRWRGAELVGRSHDGRRRTRPGAPRRHARRHPEPAGRIHVTSEVIAPATEGGRRAAAVTSPGALSPTRCVTQRRCRDAVPCLRHGGVPTDLVSISGGEAGPYAGLLERAGPASSSAATPSRWSTRTAGRPEEVEMNLVGRWTPGCPQPTQPPVFDLAAGTSRTPDLLDVEAGVVGEYDGRSAPARLPTGRRPSPRGRPSAGSVSSTSRCVAEDRSDTDLMVGGCAPNRARRRRGRRQRRLDDSSHRRGGCRPTPSSCAAPSRQRSATGSCGYRATA